MSSAESRSIRSFAHLPDASPAAQSGRQQPDRLDLAVEGRGEIDLLDAPLDVVARARRALRPARRDLDDQEVRGVALHRQRRQRRIGDIAAVPVQLAVDFDRLMQQRQAGRSQDRLDGQLLVAEDAQAAPC